MYLSAEKFYINHGEQMCFFQFESVINGSRDHHSISRGGGGGGAVVFFNK